MKVFHINCNYLGTTLHQIMVEKLDSIGVENSVFVPTFDGTKIVIKPNENVTVSNCFKKWDKVVFQHKQKKILKAIEKNCTLENVDVIHAYTLFTDGNAAYTLSKKYGIPYVVAVRNTDVNTFFKKMIHLRKRGVEIMRKAEKVFFLSESYRKIVLEKYVPEEYRDEVFSKTEIIPNGIDDFWHNNKYAEKLELGNVVKLIYAGRIDKNKNITTTQKAMKILREKGINTRLTVVGKVEDSAEYELISSSDDTDCKPAEPKEKLIDEYRNSDIFVMPSYRETFGLVYAEAMSQGLPVVYTQGQGFDGQFEEGEVGYHVPSDSPEAIADAIEKICADYSGISHRAAEGSTRFNWDSIVSSYISFYEQIKNDNKNTGYPQIAAG